MKQKCGLRYVKTAIFCICGSNNWETVVETGKPRWATYRFDPYDRHNLLHLTIVSMFEMLLKYKIITITSASVKLTQTRHSHSK